MQHSFFDFHNDDLISINEAASTSQVSSATIRNWVKVGHINIEQKKYVSRSELKKFISKREGAGKLKSRANKSKKDLHDHDKLSAEFKILIDSWKSDLDTLSDHYEAGLSESFRNKEGIYYTPSKVVNEFFQLPNVNVKNLTFLDPCCGSGNFIIRALELGFKPSNIYGYDTDANAVHLTKRRIFEKTGFISENIVNENFLNASINPGALKFDVIFTNPPWGKKIDKEEKIRYGELFNAGNSLDTCSLFMFACFYRCVTSGYIGLLLPDSFFNIATFESARIGALSLNIQKIIDHERPFKGLLSKAFSIVLKNEPKPTSNGDVICVTSGSVYNRALASFARNPKSIFNFKTTGSDAKLIEHVFSVPHISLTNKARWGLGVVTGDNKKFIRQNAILGYMPVHKGSDITREGLAKATSYIPRDLTLYQQVAPTEIYEAPIKLIYKFISSDLCFFCDTEQRYVLNSINMLIPAPSFPITPFQLCSLLNSDLMNWLFKNIFVTHKVLRADIESLPIHVDFFKKHSVFDEKRYLDFLFLERDNSGTFRIKSRDY